MTSTTVFWNKNQVNSTFTIAFTEGTAVNSCNFQILEGITASFYLLILLKENILKYKKRASFVFGRY